MNDSLATDRQVAASATLHLARRVRTMTDDDRGDARGLLVADGRVVRVLSTDEAHDVAESAFEQGIQVVDHGDRTVMPGFVDPHAHAEVACAAEVALVDVRAPACPDIPSVLAKLRAELHRADNGWLVAQANLFFDRKLAEGRFPTRVELDGVSAEIAIAIRAGGHLSILNSKALEIAGIDDEYRESTESITGRPDVERDEHGAPTGVVREMDKLLPLPELTGDGLRDAIRVGMRDLFTANGVTTVGEITNSRSSLATFDGLIARGELAARMGFYLWVPGTVTLDEACDHASWLRFEAGADRIGVLGVKVWSDGGYSAARAALTKPYATDEHNCGEVSLSMQEVTTLAQRTRAAGLQLAIHANGDRAQLEVCETLAALEPYEGDGPAPRIRIEHAGNYVPDFDGLTDAWRRAGITPVPQPVFIANFAEFLPDYVGEESRAKQFPLRSLLEQGWPISGSCDVWVGSEIGQTNPMKSIVSTVARRTFHDLELPPSDEGVTIEQALRMHTINGAIALGLEDVVGSLEPGKFADFVVFDRDPVETPVDELMGLRVEQVYVDGILVHEAEPSTEARSGPSA